MSKTDDETRSLELIKPKLLLPNKCRLRHFMITKPIISGLSFKQIADMCGIDTFLKQEEVIQLSDEVVVGSNQAHSSSTTK